MFKQYVINFLKILLDSLRKITLMKTYAKNLDFLMNFLTIKKFMKCLLPKLFKLIEKNVSILAYMAKLEYGENTLLMSDNPGN